MLATQLASLPGSYRPDVAVIVVGGNDVTHRVPVADSVRHLVEAAAGVEGIEVVIAGVDPVPTFVFDEVDAGVGGRAAVEVGRRLAALATSSQVLVVTHLPQVAAYADQHVSVRKRIARGRTHVEALPLGREESVAELAGLAQTMRRMAAPVRATSGDLLDTAAELAGLSLQEQAPLRRQLEAAHGTALARGNVSASTSAAAELAELALEQGEERSDVGRVAAE